MPFSSLSSKVRTPASSTCHSSMPIMGGKCFPHCQGLRDLGHSSKAQHVLWRRRGERYVICMYNNSYKRNAMSTAQCEELRK